MITFGGRQVRCLVLITPSPTVGNGVKTLTLLARVQRVSAMAVIILQVDYTFEENRQVSFQKQEAPNRQTTPKFDTSPPWHQTLP